MLRATADGDDDDNPALLSLERVLEAASVLLRAQQQQQQHPYDNDDYSHYWCHPSSHDYEPYVPHCDGSVQDREDHSFHGQHSRSNNRFLTANDVVDNNATNENLWQFYLTNLGGAAGCIAAVALIAGLFLGYLTLDAFDLRIIARASLQQEERQWATTILPIVVERHRVLVTLLILNGLAYETLPIFLDNLVPSWVAILLSVTLIMVFGEIIPSGIFTGPRQLYLGYVMAPLMNFFLWITYPFAKPLALLLDYLVHQGSEPIDDEGYHRGELSALVRIQHEQDVARVNGIANRSAHVATTGRKASAVTPQRGLFTTSSTPNWADVKQELLDKVRERRSDSTDDWHLAAHPNDQQQQYNYEYDNRSAYNHANGHNNHAYDEESHVATVAPPLHPTEVDVIEGALQMKTSLAMDVFTPLNKIYAIPVTMTLDKRNICTIYGQGFSRVPVYEPDPDDAHNISRVMGFLLVRALILVDWDDKRQLSTLALQRPVCVNPRMNLVDLLRILQTEGPIMTFVCARPDLANRALDKELPIPPEAGFMGIVTLEDIMESILQEKIYDEQDIRDRDRAVSILTRWAATKLQDFYRRKKKQRQSSLSPSSRKKATADAAVVAAALSESTPLLSSISETNHRTTTVNNHNGSIV